MSFLRHHKRSGARSLGVLGLALVMGANVLLRYGFSIGSIWMQELEWHLLVSICLISAFLRVGSGIMPPRPDWHSVAHG